MVWSVRGKVAWWGFLMWVLVTGIYRSSAQSVDFDFPLIPPSTDGKKQRSLDTLIVLGSGGHTAEILNVVGALNLKDISHNATFQV